MAYLLVLKQFNFLFWDNLYLQRVKNSTEHAHLHHFTDVEILCNHGTFVETKNLALVLHYLLKSRPFRCHMFSHQCPVSTPESNPGFHVAISCTTPPGSWDSLWCFFVFVTLMVLKSMGQVFCRMSLRVSVSDAFSWVFWREYYRGKCLLIHSYQEVRPWC